MDPLTALAALRAAYNGIQFCCECLSEGTVQVQKIKKAAEQAQALVKDAKTFWGIIKGLFGIKPPPAPAAAAAPAAKATKPKDEYIRHVPTEDDIVQQFVKHVGDFFQQHRDLSEYCERRYAEVYAMDRPDPRDILELSQIKHELDGAYGKLSEMMRVQAPPQLGPLWDNFNSIYGAVQDEQHARRERERIKRNQDAWLHDQTRIFLIDRLVAVAVALGLAIWVWALMWSLGWQDVTPPGFGSS